MMDELEINKIEDCIFEILAGNFSREEELLYWLLRAGKTFSQARKVLEGLHYFKDFVDQTTIH